MSMRTTMGVILLMAVGVVQAAQVRIAHVSPHAKTGTEDPVPGVSYTRVADIFLPATSGVLLFPLTVMGVGIDTSKPVILELVDHGESNKAGVFDRINIYSFASDGEVDRNSFIPPVPEDPLFDAVDRTGLGGYDEFDVTQATAGVVAGRVTPTGEPATHIGFLFTAVEGLDAQGNSVDFTSYLRVTLVPAPAALPLLGSAVVAFATMRRRRLGSPS